MAPQVKSIQKLLLSRLEIMKSFVFGKTEITDEITNKAENFLLKFISNKNLDILVTDGTSYIKRNCISSIWKNILPQEAVWANI